jgi:hypothetical protein
MNNSLGSLSPQSLRHAADLAERIQSLQRELERTLGAPAQTQGRAGAGPKRRLSPQAIANIRAGVRKRWAAANAGKRGPVAGKRRRKMSAAARARLAMLARARWKAAKAAGRKAL